MRCTTNSVFELKKHQNSNVQAYTSAVVGSKSTSTRLSHQSPFWFCQRERKLDLMLDKDHQQEQVRKQFQES